MRLLIKSFIKNIGWQHLLLLIILGLAIWLRFWGIRFGLPYLYHPDEPNKIYFAQQILKTGDLNPHYFLKPSFFIYLNTIVYLPYIALERILGNEVTISSLQPPFMLVMGTGYTPQPRTVLIGRLLSLTMGTLSVLGIYFLAKIGFENTFYALLSAFFLAIAPDQISHSRYITPDIYVVFFTILTAMGAYRIYQYGKSRDYLFAFISVGLAASVKYNAGLVFIFPLASHVLRKGINGLLEWKFYLFGLSSLLTFIILNPYTVLDFPTFYEGLTSEASHYSTGHPGMEGQSFAFYINFFFNTYGIIAILGLIGILIALIKRDRKWIIFLSFPLIYFVFISCFKVRNDRTGLPISPFLILFCVYTLKMLFDRFWQGRDIHKVFFTIVLTLMLAIPMISQDVQNAQHLTQKDSRETARVWIKKHIPLYTHIYLEAYCPYVDPSQYHVGASNSLIDHDIEWYQENGYNYVIACQGMFQRYFNQPLLYPEQVDQYNKIFYTLQLEKEFTDGDYRVLIFRVQ